MNKAWTRTQPREPGPGEVVAPPLGVVSVETARRYAAMEPEDDWEEGADKAADRYEKDMTRNW